MRVKSLSQTDMFAKAGLMAREDLTGGSRFAGVFSTPTLNGSIFQCRANPGATAISSGNLPVNYPDTWLRLKRTGTQFTGYGGYDGVAWQQLGTATVSASNTLYCGMAVCSRVAGQAALAEFGLLFPVTNAQTAVLRLPQEPPGPSSRRTGLVISEIMFHPPARPDTRRLEFIELFNPQPFMEEISGYRLSGDISYTFPPGTILPAGACIVVAASPGDVQAVYGISNVVAALYKQSSQRPRDSSPRNKAEVTSGRNYGTAKPWPVARDGPGTPWCLHGPATARAIPRAWAASDRKGGSPGPSIPSILKPPARWSLMSILAHTDPPAS